MSHTPGPWRVQGSRIIADHDLHYVAEARPSANIKENARLIAAVPDLLEAAQDALEAIEDRILPDRDSPIAEQLRAAIAKAVQERENK